MAKRRWAQPPGRSGSAPGHNKPPGSKRAIGRGQVMERAPVPAPVDPDMPIFGPRRTATPTTRSSPTNLEQFPVVSSATKSPGSGTLNSGPRTPPRPPNPRPGKSGAAPGHNKPPGSKRAIGRGQAVLAPPRPTRTPRYDIPERGGLQPPPRPTTPRYDADMGIIGGGKPPSGRFKARG